MAAAGFSANGRAGAEPSLTGRERICITVRWKLYARICRTWQPVTPDLELSSMRVRLKDFDAARFSLHEHPVLVLEDFWNP